MCVDEYDRAQYASEAMDRDAQNPDASRVALPPDVLHAANTSDWYSEATAEQQDRYYTSEATDRHEYEENGRVPRTRSRGYDSDPQEEDEHGGFRADADASDTIVVKVGARTCMDARARPLNSNGCLIDRFLPARVALELASPSLHGVLW